MKRLKYLILIFLLLPIVAYAYDFKCRGDVFNYGDEFSCYISGGSNELVNFDEFSGEISYDAKAPFECKFSSASEGFNLNDSEDKKFSLTGKPTDNLLVSYTCTVKEKLESSKIYSLKIDNFKYHELDNNLDVSNEVLRSNDITIKEYSEDEPVVTDTRPRRTDNPDSRLKMITDPQLDFSFSGFKTVYDLEVLFEVEKLDLQITPVNIDAKYRIEGDTTLSIGDNVIDIYVTSPDESSTTCYTLNVKRLKRGEEIYYANKDATLSNLEIEGYTINFEKVVKDYTINIPYNVNYVNISTVPTNQQAKVEVSNAGDLKDGSIINITVTSEDGSTTEVYLIHVRKDKEPFDYKPYIIGGIIVVSVIILIIVIIKTNQKNRMDPLLKLKGDKRGINFGNKFDNSLVPDTDAGAGVNTDGDVNKIDLKEASKPIEMEEVLDDNMNKTVSVVSTIDLNNATLPTQQPQVVQTQPVQQTVPIQQDQVQPVQMVQPQVQQVAEPVQMVQPQVQQTVQPVQMVQPQPVQQPTPQPVQEETPHKSRAGQVVKNGTAEQIIGEPPKESNIFD